MFVYITSENKQRQQLLQRLLGIFPRPNFFTGKTNCCSYPMSFMIKMSTETGISSLFYLRLFQWHVWKQLASVNFLFVKIAENFGIATERKLTQALFSLQSSILIEIWTLKQYFLITSSMHCCYGNLHG